MFQFNTKRDSGTYWEKGRKAYLDARSGQGIEPWLCHAIEDANAPLRDVTPGLGFPWITMVLGSGCLETADASGRRALLTRPEAVRELLVDKGEALDLSESVEDLAKHFASSLIADRIDLGTGHADESESPDGEEGESAGISQLTADVVLLAALLTKFYYRASGIWPDAMRRFRDDVAVLDEEDQLASELLQSLARPIVSLGGAIAKAIEKSKRGVDVVLSEVIGAISKDLRPANDVRPELSSSNLQLMTELSWYFLTEGTTVYPGWSDVLLRLSVDGARTGLDNGRPRPVYDDITIAPGKIALLFERPTKESWQASFEEQPSDRDRFYGTAAEILRSQAKLRRKLNPAAKPPIASAFVTTFDLELEMALWRSVDGGPFIVGVPFTLTPKSDSGNRPGSLCWLGCVMRPNPESATTTSLREEQLVQLRSPAEWFLLSDLSTDNKRAYTDLPIVVHLSGCPLLERPSLVENGQPSALWTEMRDRVDRAQTELSRFEPSQLEFRHAVLIDEYAAMQQTALEFFNYKAADSSQSLSFGVPDQVTGYHAELGHTRFWMVMGVQMADTGVRHRFAHQVAAKEPPAAGVISPKRAGVVINRRIEAEHRDLLYWYGFDVVRDRCQEFTPDLERYIRHLNCPDMNSRENRHGRGLPCEI